MNQIYNKALQRRSNWKKASKIETSKMKIQSKIEENYSFWFIEGIQSTTHRQCWASQFSHFVGYQWIIWYAHIIFLFLFYTIISLIKLFTQLYGSMPLTAFEKARQNRKNRMELNKLKKSTSKSIQKKNILNQTNMLMSNRNTIKILISLKQMKRSYVSFII